MAEFYPKSTHIHPCSSVFICRLAPRSHFVDFADREPFASLRGALGVHREGETAGVHRIASLMPPVQRHERCGL
jgi:hypothetical protein